MSDQVSGSDVAPAPPTPAIATQPPRPAAATNGFAVAALVLGIVGLVLTLAFRVALVCDVLAVVFGALGRIRARDGAPNGGLAKAGMILGIVGLGLLLLLVILVHTMGLNHGHFYRFRHYGYMRRY